MSKQHNEKIPVAMRSVYNEIVEMIDSFCQQYLNHEYEALSRELTAALARKRNSPLLRGKSQTWACAVIYALGTVNFLFDKTQTPHMRADELCTKFGISQSTASNKAKAIRDMFNMYQLKPRWCLPSLVDQNLMMWLVKVDGLIVDVRDMPREVQEIAYEKQLIPYIPIDRQAEEAADPQRLF